jgi:hypothetical protein
MTLASQAQLTWDADGGADLNWSNQDNWNSATPPANQDLIFAADGVTANASTPGNIVDTSITASSLSYQNTGGSSVWQVTSISENQTLTLEKASGSVLLVGSSSNNTSATNAAIRGLGHLEIDAENANITITNGGTTSQRATLDLSGLGSFTAVVNELNLGRSSRGWGTLSLSNDSEITANTLNIGGPASGSTNSGAGNGSELLLGTNTNISADVINIGQGYGIGKIAFRAGGSTIDIVGNNNAAVDMTIGNTGTTEINNGQSSSADFSLGTVNATLDDLLVGRRENDAGNAGGTYGASFSMAAGVVTANTVVAGRTANSMANTTGVLNSSINISGGSFTAGAMTLGHNSGTNTAAGSGGSSTSLTVSGSASVHVTNDVILGRRTGTETTPFNVTVNVSGGVLLIDGNLYEDSADTGEASTTVNLSGGTLNMDHGGVSVDNFNFTGGTLKNVSAFNAATTGGLTLTGPATLAYDLDGAFTSTNLTGALTLGGTSNLQLILANGTAPQASYTLVLNDDADFVSGSFATINGASFGAGNTFTLSNDLGTHEFALTYTGGSGNDVVVNLVPEPSASLAGFIGLAALALRRRK